MQPLDRITSYNVCYTKLLRIRHLKTKGNIEKRYIGSTDESLVNPNEHRITSYNVCYTKLLRMAEIPKWC